MGEKNGKNKMFGVTQMTNERGGKKIRWGVERQGVERGQEKEKEAAAIGAILKQVMVFYRQQEKTDKQGSEKRGEEKGC